MLVPLNKKINTFKADTGIKRDSPIRINVPPGKYKQQQIYLLLSTSAVEDAAKSTGLQIAYFKKSLFFSKEIFSRDVPLKVALVKNNLKMDIDFMIQILDHKSFTLQIDGLNYIYNYRERILLPGCEFFVSKGADVESSEQPLFVKISNMHFLSQQIINSIDLRSADKDTSSVILTISTGNPLQIHDFFKLLKKNYIENDPEKRSIQTALDGVKQQLDTVAHQFSVDKKTKTHSRQADKMKSENQANLKLYMRLLQRRQDLNTLLLSQESSLGSASITIVRNKKHTAWILISGLFAGATLALSYFYILSIAPAHKYSYWSPIKSSSIPVLGEIKYIPTLSKIILPAGADTVAGRQILSIKGHISGLALNKVIAVLSMNPGEGKSFFSNNLGIALAHDHKKVIVIQMGLHNDIHELVAQNNAPGLNDYLQDIDGSLRKFIRPTHLEKLSVMTPGNEQITITGTIDHLKMTVLFEVLRTKYDHIIIDANLQADESSATLKRLPTDLLILIITNRRSALMNDKQIENYINGWHGKKIAMVVNNLFDKF